MKNGQIVTLIIGDKAHQCSRKMALSAIELAKDKFKKENMNAIVAVEKREMISLMKDVFETTEKLLEEVDSWERGGYKCHYVQVKGK